MTQAEHDSKEEQQSPLNCEFLFINDTKVHLMTLANYNPEKVVNNVGVRFYLA